MADPLGLGKDAELYSSEETEEAYRQHLTEITEYRCDFCGKPFDREERAMKHMEREHLDQVFRDG